ncbi:MAG: flagellar hook-associated protein FlgL [Pseudomonadota bacterium]|nr:flagellar hook-associated protein FlgL [Pseudomonadota bacterium]
MRITTLQSYRSGVATMLQRQEELNKTQQQVSSGLRVTTAADDPIAATKILQLQQDLALREQFDDNMTAAQNRLELEESVLSSVTDYYNRLEELVVEAGNGSLTQADREMIATEVSEIQEALVDLFNTRDSNGEYIFAGYQGGEAPFVENASGRYDYTGDDGQRILSISNSTTVATGDSGKDLFVDIVAASPTFTASVDSTNTGSITVNPGYVVDEEAYAEFYPDDIIITFNAESAIDPAGPNYTVTRASDGRVVDGLVNVTYDAGADIRVAGIELSINGNPEPGDQAMADSSAKQGITDTLDRLISGLNSLGDNTTDKETLSYLLEDTLDNLANALASVNEVQSKIGARLNVIENTSELSADIQLVNKGVLSELQDVDLAEAVSLLALQTTILEAAQQSYTTINQLSLFNSI